MKTERPIFDLIEESIVDGRLPDDFILPEEGFDGDPRMKMAPGAMDGLCIYHMVRKALSDEDRNAVAEAIQAASSGSDNAYELFKKLGEKHRAIEIIDDMQSCIRKDAESLNQGELLRFAFEDLILGGTDSECVKFGLVITELYGELNDQLKRVFREVGLCDEFTIFSVFNMQTWKNGNEEIFALAKRVDGWGKIHAVERLEPETQEIKDWILYEGVDNRVTPQYLALTCMVKSGAAERLKGHPTKEELSAISHILSFLFDEGPVWGISQLPDAKEVLANYLKCAEQQDLDVEDYETVLDIRDYSAGKAEYPDIAQRADLILGSDPCAACITEAIQEGKGVRLAQELGIPYKAQLLALMARDFRGACYWCNTLMKDPDYVDPVLSIYRKEVPPEIIEQDPSNEYEFGEEYEVYRQIAFMLQNLSEYPGSGTDYLMKTISAPTTRCRVQTIRTLKSWIKKAGMPLESCYPALYERLKAAYEMERSDKLKADIETILNGEINFPDQ